VSYQLSEDSYFQINSEREQARGPDLSEDEEEEREEEETGFKPGIISWYINTNHTDAYNSSVYYFSPSAVHEYCPVCE
jgi:hypothetical protein